MLWAEAMPFLQGENGAECEVAAGSLGGASAGAPPPNSWAADPDHDVGVFYITIPPGGSFTLPPASRGAPVNRSALFHARTNATVVARAAPSPILG